MNKSTRQYVAEVKRRLGISSDYALAKALNISKQGAALLAKGDSVMSTNTAAKVAEILELEPLAVIADAELERGSSPDLWKRIRAAAAVAGAVIAGAVLYLALMNERSAFDIATISGAFPMNGDALAFALGLLNSNTHCVAFAGAVLAWLCLEVIASGRAARPDAGLSFR